MANISKVPLSRLIPDSLKGMRPVIDAIQRELIAVQEAQVLAAQAAADAAQASADTAQATAEAAAITAAAAVGGNDVNSEGIRNLNFNTWDRL